MYQHPHARLAPDAGQREARADEATSDSFENEIRDIARRLIKSVPRLSARERKKLWELGRDESRYPMKTLRMLLSISSRSTQPEDREAFPELLRGEILRQAPDPARCVTRTFDVETAANGPANEAQRAFELNPCRETWQRCKAELKRQMAATRDALDAVLTWKPAR